MLVMRTTEDPTDPIGKLIRAQQTVGFDHFALAMNPFGLYRIQPRALLGQRRQLTILTPPVPPFLTSRLCLPSQRLTSPLVCQLALSQMRSRNFLPIASSFWVHHPRNRVVMPLTGRPSTNLNHV